VAVIVFGIAVVVHEIPPRVWVDLSGVHDVVGVDSSVDDADAHSRAVGGESCPLDLALQRTDQRRAVVHVGVDLPILFQPHDARNLG
jgi:hypothetical protein